MFCLVEKSVEIENDTQFVYCERLLQSLAEKELSENVRKLEKAIESYKKGKK